MEPRSISRAKLWSLVVFFQVVACAPVNVPPARTILNENQMIDLIDHPTKWHRREVTVKIYPYDFGFGSSDDGWTYSVCFEPCERAIAERSLFLIRTNENRFKGYRGNQAAVVRARYDACNVDYPCADLWAGVFKELGGSPS